MANVVALAHVEPDATLEYQGTQGEVGAGYSWTGDLIGEGNMKLAAIQDDMLDMKLQFIRPFKSNARVTFELEEPYR